MKGLKVLLSFLLLMTVADFTVSSEAPDIRVEPTTLFFSRAADTSASTIASMDSPVVPKRINFYPDIPAAPGEILVKFKTGMFKGNPKRMGGIIQTSDPSVNSLFAQLRVKSMERVFQSTRAPLGDIYRLRFTAPVSLEEALNLMGSHQDVEWAEPSYLGFASAVPNDPDFPSQWGLEKIEADLAWDVIQGDPNIVIAVIDTGVDYNHPDLSANIWRNPGEIPGNGIDDEGNGFVDDVVGWDFVSVPQGGIPEQRYPAEAAGEDMSPPDNDPMDFFGHGTLCAGVAAAVTNNGIGIAGTGWNSKIMVVRAGYKTADGSGMFHLADGAAAMEYAANNGADVISISWGSYIPLRIVLDAVQYINAQYEGAVLVAGAGNDDSDFELYPASFPGVISVAASDRADNRAVFSATYASNYGRRVDIAAPGVDIISTMLGGGYYAASGTSMATPFVAGVVGLMLSQNPTLTHLEVKQQLLNSGRGINWGVVRPTKRLNAHWALLYGENAFMVLNQGAGLLNVTNIVPEHGSSWLQTDITTFTVAGHSSQLVIVSLDLTGVDAGTYIDKLLIYSDDPDESPYPHGVYVTLEIPNNAPYIIGLTAEPNPVLEDQTSTFTVVAQDDDGHSLIYDWDASSGSIIGSGNVIIYHPPDVSEQTICVVGVTVSDSHGGSDYQSLEVVVDAIPAYTITASAGEHGGITPAGMVEVPHGDTQTFFIMPDENHHVVDVLVDGSSVGAMAEYTFVNVSSSHTIKATFAIDTYTITATAGEHGGISPSGAVEISHGGVHVLAIVPDVGHHVADVLVDGASIGAVTAYRFENITSSHTIHATFAIDIYLITATTGEHGGISPMGVVKMPFGSSQTFTIMPDAGYHVADVLVDGVSIGVVTEYTFVNVTSGHTIEATFAIDTYIITATFGEHGSISPSGAVEVSHGSYRVFTITPDTNYHVADVLVDGSSVGALAGYRFENISSNRAIHVEFVADPVAPYTIALAVGWNLISIPVQLSDNRLDVVLRSIRSNCKAVWTYNTTDKRWQRYIVDGPVSLNNLATIEPGKGYWVRMASPAVLVLDQQGVAQEPISLEPGWNLVGFNYLTPLSVEEALLSIAGNLDSVWTYNAEGEWLKYIVKGPGFLNNLKFFEPNKGYWIHSSP